ncbi:HAD family hydrolase [Nocardiopsis sediminis]|uniref:HAD family hydrolase n=1 Tax=Nocardiopsis sediminis TaxID=1778267 RepID=A0ABV8FPX9_9ACTN
MLDFDGPVCSAFAGYPAPEVAEHLREQAAAAGVRIPARLATESDPMVVLRELFELASHLHEPAEAALTAAEVQSVATAEPTPGAVEFMRACVETGRPLAVVSNNSEEAVRAFMDKHALGSLVRDVIGRDKVSPRLMKPDPHSLRLALDALAAEPKGSVLVGDSTTDVEAAHAAGATAVGFANRSWKAEAFRELGAEIVVHDMQELAEALLHG